MAVAQYWFRRRPRLALSAIVATGLVILIVVLEVGARIIFPAWGPTFAGDRITFCEHDDLLGWAHKPGMSGNFSREEFSVEVNINSYRLRDREYSLKRNEKNRMLNGAHHALGKSEPPPHPRSRVPPRPGTLPGCGVSPTKL